MTTHLSRRDWFATGAALAAASLATAPALAYEGPAAEPFGYCLNTSTISGQKLKITEVVDVAAQAGYKGLEPWIRELEAHVQGGGSLKDLGKQIKDRGLSVESAIGFAEWAVDDDARRRKGLEQAKREMDMVRQIGGARIAAPPAGATDRADMDLRRVAERYRALLELGDTMGVVPQVEVWGFSKCLTRLSEAAFVAIESGHKSACILADAYHLYKGGSHFEGLRQLNGRALHVFHFNDYPADPPRATITDALRVFPGDGVAPLKPLLLNLKEIGFTGMLSLELFNRDYWKQDALTVARTGLKKMRDAVLKGLWD